MFAKSYIDNTEYRMSKILTNIHICRSYHRKKNNKIFMLHQRKYFKQKKLKNLDK